MLRVLLSSCLAGAPVRYHGGHARVEHPVLERWIREGRVITACPEMLAGLPAPRPAAEISGGEVITAGGEVVTASYRRGAEIAGAEVGADGVAIAILKNGSPSCGSTYVYDGTFTGTKAAGEGITAALLRSRGIAVFSEEQIDEAAQYLASLSGAPGSQPVVTCEKPPG